MSEALSNPYISVEYCEQCQCETQHSVSIAIREEAPGASQVSYSREPYRVTVCKQCETEIEVRMNDQ